MKKWKRAQIGGSLDVVSLKNRLLAGFFRLTSLSLFIVVFGMLPRIIRRLKMKKWLYVICTLLGFSVFAYVYANNSEQTGVDPVYKINVAPKGAVGSIHFMGKGIVFQDSSGKKLKPINEKRSVKKVFSTATMSVVQVNPCYVKWCTSGTECEYYKISDGACPSWW